MSKRIILSVVGAAILSAASIATAQSPLNPTEGKKSASEREAWYYQSEAEQPTPRMIIQRKAQARAAARIRRIELNHAYGISNARPTALPTPTGTYSPVWQMPGGRPYAWYTARTPVYYYLWR